MYQHTVEALSDQYKSVFSSPKPDLVVNDPKLFFMSSPYNTLLLTDIQFGVEDLILATKDMSADSAAGLDGIPAKFLKECSENICPVLNKIWRKSLDDGTIPFNLLVMAICPLHKRGSRAIPKNYRPVALTSLNYLRGL